MGLKNNWKAAKVQKFRHRLLRWYLKHRRHLPWRYKPTTPYRVWISEIMLQQTQTKTVIPYYERFLNRFPDIKSLSRSSEREVLEFWSGLGYYSRARNLHRAARLILERHGDFPGDLNSILALPGIGRYTAGAICSLAFNQPQPIVDGNIQRVVTRLRGIRRKTTADFFWSQMASWISPKRPADFNQAMMELGALICVPQHPRCEQCPVARYCDAYKRDIQDRIPKAKSKQEIRRMRIAVLVLEWKQKILLASLHKSAIIPGEWGLPSCLVPEGDAPHDAASGLCQELLGRSLKLTPLILIHHSISNYRITANGFLWQGERLPSGLREMKGCRWASPIQCKQLLTSSLFHKILLQIAD